MKRYLDDLGLTYFWAKIKSTFASSGQSGTNIVPADRAVSIPIGTVDSTSTSTKFTATVPGITELRDGVCVLLWNNVVSSASGCTLNINGLGAKPFYNTWDNSVVSTSFAKNRSYFFVYNSTKTSGGCWDAYAGYYGDTNSIGYDIRHYYNGGKKPKTALYRYQFLLTCKDGLLLPINTVNNSTATTKVLTTESFDPFGEVYYYGSTATINANAAIGTSVLYSQATITLFDLRYSFNTGTTLTAGKDIYLVCVPQSDGNAKLHTSPIAFELPTTEDGLIYKRLGRTYDTYRIVLEQHKPCYYFKNGAIRQWTNASDADIEILDLT